MPLTLSSTVIAELTDVSVDFAGREALRSVNVSIARQSLTVIAGPNGAGKSTLLEVLAGVRIPREGQAAIHAEALAFVPQRVVVSARLPVTVRDVVTMGAWGRAGFWRRIDARGRQEVAVAIDRLGLHPLQRVPYGELSGGQQQRTLLAQGLARGADLLLLDEPTTALDVDSTDRILAAIESEIARGVTVVCVTHDPALLMAADHVVRLADGRVVSFGT